MYWKLRDVYEVQVFIFNLFALISFFSCEYRTEANFVAGAKLYLYYLRAWKIKWHKIDSQKKSIDIFTCTWEHPTQENEKQMTWQSLNAYLGLWTKSEISRKGLKSLRLKTSKSYSNKVCLYRFSWLSLPSSDDKFLFFSYREHSVSLLYLLFFKCLVQN